MIGRAFSFCARLLPALLLLAVLGWAAWERFRLPITPCADPDVWTYLEPGLNLLSGHKFNHVYGQCFLYPWLLYVALWLGHDFRWITVAQNGLGIGTGVLLFGCWLQLRRLLPAPRLPAWIFQILGVVPVGTYLFSTASIEFERSLRPDSIFPFFVVFNLFCNLRFIRDRFLDGRPRRALLSGTAAGFLSVAAFLIKPSFSAVLLLGNLPLLISLFHPGQSPKGKMVLVAAPLVTAGLLLIWPEWTLRRSDQTEAMFLSRSLFSVHANFIDDQLAEDLQRHAVTPYSHDFTAAAHAKLTEALAESRGGTGKYWPVLGFNPDNLIHSTEDRESFNRWLVDRLPERSDAETFYQYYYRRTWSHQPLRMAGKVWRQVLAFYRFDACPAYVMGPQYNLAEKYELSAVCFSARRRPLENPMGLDLLTRTFALEDSKLRSGPYPWPSWIPRVLASSYVFCCLWTILLGFGMWFFDRSRRAYGLAALVILLLFTYNFGTVLTLAIGHSLDVGRYSQYQLAYTVLPQLAAIWLSLEILAALILRAVSPVPSLSGEAPESPVTQWLSGGYLVSEAPDLKLASERMATVSGEGSAVTDPSLQTISLPGPGINGSLAELPQTKSDGFILIETESGQLGDHAGHLVKLYNTRPVDLILGCRRSGKPVASMIAAAMLRFIYGWSVADPLGGVWLCSARFYGHARTLVPPAALSWKLAMIVAALDQGFSIRETKLPAGLPGQIASREADRQSLLSQGRCLHALAMRMFRSHPWRTLLGVVALGLCIAGLAMSGVSWRQAHKKRSHQKVVKVWTAPSLVTCGSLLVLAGLLTGSATARISPRAAD